MTKTGPNTYDVKNGEIITITVTPNNGAIGAVTCVDSHSQMPNSGSPNQPAFRITIAGPTGKQQFVRLDFMFTSATGALAGSKPFFMLDVATNDLSGTDDPDADRVFKSSTGPLNNTQFIFTIV